VSFLGTILHSIVEYISGIGIGVVLWAALIAFSFWVSRILLPALAIALPIGVVLTTLFPFPDLVSSIISATYAPLITFLVFTAISYIVVSRQWSDDYYGERFEVRSIAVTIILAAAITIAFLTVTRHMFGFPIPTPPFLDPIITPDAAPFWWLTVPLLLTLAFA